MDNDMSIYYLDKYKLTDSNNNVMKNVKSITRNDPRTFADRYLSIMGSGKRNIDLVGADMTQEKYLEGFYPKLLDLNDDINSDIMIEPIDECLNFFLGLRGWGALLVLMCHENGKYMPNILALDPRWMKWCVDSKRLLWASYRVRLNGVGITGLIEGDPVIELDPEREYLVELVWDDKNLEVQLCPSGSTQKYQLIGSRPHGLPRCPIVIAPVPTAPFLISGSEDTSKSFSRQGESIYAPNRDLYGEVNELTSIWATMTKQQVFSPLAYIGERKGLTQRPYGLGIVVELKPGEQLIEIPTKELSASAQALYAQFLALTQRGSLPNVDYGELSFELSALAIAKLTESRDQVFAPRIKAKQKLYRKACYMIREQIATGQCYESKVDEENLIKVETDQFKEKFTIHMNFYTVSPEENIANYTVANSAAQIGRPKLVIFRDILKSPNPKEELMQAELENAQKEIPELRLYDYGIAQAGGSIKDERVAESRTKLILWKLKQTMKTQDANAPELAMPNIASQAKPELKVPKGAAQKIVQEETRRQGIAQQNKGKAAQAAGVK
jgi:hypothetical protein